MKYIIIIAVAVGVIVSIRKASMHKDAAPLPATVASDERVTWIHDLPSALARAKELKKPLLVDFHATWCPPCKMMEQRTFPDPGVVAELHHWIPVKIDVDANPLIAQQFGIRVMPTMLALNSNGTVIARNEGYMGPDALLQFAARSRSK